ncbi:MAG: autotransporter strand-loop-strand O-heptosyltransferase, partial [Pseudonocardiaceae bacterium]
LAGSQFSPIAAKARLSTSSSAIVFRRREADDVAYRALIPLSGKRSEAGKVDGTVLPRSSPDSTQAAGADRATPNLDSGKNPYPAASELPTQLGPRGIRFDFNRGARLLLPNRRDGAWRVRLRDLDTHNVLFETENKGAVVASAKRYYVRIGLEVHEVDDAGIVTEVFAHCFDAREREVLIQFPVGTIGDTLGWFPYAARFATARGARVICAMSGLLIPLLRDAYPHIRFVTHEEAVAQELASRVYATYLLGLFFTDTENIFQPTDFRHVGLHRTAGYILGVDPHEEPPRLALPDESRPIAEPYVCIATQSSTQCKYWNNPRGWREVIGFIKTHGFR